MEALSYILDDDMERATAASADFAFNIDNLLDPFEVGGKRAFGAPSFLASRPAGTRLAPH